MHRTRRRTFDELRLQFQSLVQSQAAAAAGQQSLDQLLRLITLFFCASDAGDAEKLKHLSRLMIREKEVIAALHSKQPDLWLHRIIRILQFSVHQMRLLSSSSPSAKAGHSADTSATTAHSSNNSSGSSQANPIAVPLRLIEVYTDPVLYSDPAVVPRIWDSLIRGEYFATLRLLMDQKVPVIYESTVRPPTPLSASLLDLVVQPLKPGSMTQQACSMLVKQMFSSGPLSCQRKLFLLPALLHNDLIPSPILIRSLSSSLTTVIPVNVETAFAVLSLLSSKVNAMTTAEKQEYLSVLKQLSACLPQSPLLTHEPDDEVQVVDDEDGDEDERMEDGSEEERALAAEVITLLNQAPHVSGLLSLIDMEDVSQRI